MASQKYYFLFRPSAKILRTQTTSALKIYHSHLEFKKHFKDHEWPSPFLSHTSGMPVLPVESLFDVSRWRQAEE